MSARTPGPWKDQSEAHDAECEMYSEACGCESREKLKKECNALREALVDLLPLAESGAAEQSPPFADDRLLVAARAAIAKATREAA
jgi:hypothetical protein